MGGSPPAVFSSRCHIGVQLVMGILFSWFVLWCLRVSLEKIVLCDQEGSSHCLKDRLEALPHYSLELDGFYSVRDKIKALGAWNKEKQ